MLRTVLLQPFGTRVIEVNKREFVVAGEYPSRGDLGSTLPALMRAKISTVSRDRLWGRGKRSGRMEGTLRRRKRTGFLESRAWVCSCVASISLTGSYAPGALSCSNERKNYGYG